MGNWRTIALPSLKRDSVIKALELHELDWHRGVHLTATQSLTKSFEENADPAIAVSTFIDLVLLPLLVKPLGVDRQLYPTWQDPLDLDLQNMQVFGEANRNWRLAVNRSKLKHDLLFDQSLTDFLESKEASAEARLLRRSKSTLRTTLKQLENASLTASDVVPGSPISSLAQEFWKFIEARPEYKYIAHQRQQMWQRDNPHLQEHISDAFKQAFGQRFQGLLFLHGFYFFTPIQLAFFNRLLEQEKLQIVFVVHDDGHAPSFETWRHYFGGNLGLPAIEYESGFPTDRKAPIYAFDAGLRGSSLGAGLSECVKVTQFDDVTQMIRTIDQVVKQQKDEESEAPTLQMYAADHKNMKRYDRRFSLHSKTESSPLFQLPAGKFLISLQEIISRAARDQTKIEFSGAESLNLIDYLSSSHGGTLGTVEIYSTLTYFEGCRFLADWESRAAQLVEAVEASESLIFEQGAVNPTTLLPWVQIGSKKAEFLRSILLSLSSLLSGVARLQEVSFAEYKSSLNTQLKKALRNNSFDDILSGLDNFDLGDSFKFSVENVVEIVGALLGKHQAYEDDEYEDFLADGTLKAGIKPLRNLDIYAYQDAKSDIRLLNLSDVSFPSAKPLNIWPFDPSELCPEGEESSLGLQVLKLNSSMSGLSDLYLFRCAIDAISPNSDCVTHLSWVTEIAGEKHNVSPLVAMLLKPSSSAHPVLHERMGGLEISAANMDQLDDETFVMPDFIGSVGDVRDEIKKTFKEEELASYFYCERRFALQWALGTSPAFDSSHTQNMLFGNLIQIIRDGLGRERHTQTDTISESLFPHLSEGQKASSKAKRRVIFRKGAPRQWALNLGGKKTPELNSLEDQSAVELRKSFSYQRAVAEDASTWFALHDSSVPTILPSGPEKVSAENKGELCNLCPVATSCNSKALRTS